MTNEQIVLEIQDGRTELLEQLWEQNQGFINKAAKKYAGHIEAEDAQQESYFALAAAVERWDPNGGASFTSYLYYWIEAILEQYAARNSNLKRSVFSRTMKYKRTLEDLRQELGRDPTDREACERLGITQTELKILQDAVKQSEAASLDDERETPEGDRVALKEMIQGGEDPADGVINSEYQRELKETIWREVDELPQEQAAVIRERYQTNKTAAQIGEDIGKTGQNVFDIERRGFRTLREPKHRRKLEPFLYDEVYTKAVKGTGAGIFNRKWESATEREALRLATADPPD